MAQDEVERRSGTQSIERAMRLLKAITARSAFGWRASDLAVHCGLDRGTTQRMLACLVRERLVRRRADRHYAPGPLLFEMGLALSAHAAFREACAPILARLADPLQAHALLCVRSGSESVCIAAAGTPAYLGLAFDVGTRRPLTATAAGVAILIALPREEAQRIVDHHLRQAEVPDEPKRDALLRMWRRSAALGYAVNQGFTARGVNAVGVPLLDADDRAFGSLALAAPVARLPAARLPAIAAGLAYEAQAIRQLVRRTCPEGAYNGPD